VSAIGQAISDTRAPTCDAAIDDRPQGGVKVSYDTNLRLRLWDLDTARATIHATCAHCDILLPSLDDSQQLTGLQEADEIADFYLKLGAPTGGRSRWATKAPCWPCPASASKSRRIASRRSTPPARARHLRRQFPGPPAGGRRSAARRHATPMSRRRFRPRAMARLRRSRGATPC
jgi:hypothetical protein